MTELKSVSRKREHWSILKDCKLRDRWDGGTSEIAKETTGMRYRQKIQVNIITRRVCMRLVACKAMMR